MLTLRPLIQLSLICICGCSSNELGAVPATGHVTLNGRSIGNANVTFISESSGPAAFAVTDKDGQFELRTGTVVGAIPGRYKVLIQKDRSADLTIPAGISRPDYMRQNDVRPQPIVPAFYGSVTDSPLGADITTDTLNHYEFNLSD